MQKGNRLRCLRFLPPTSTNAIQLLSLNCWWFTHNKNLVLKLMKIVSTNFFPSFYENGKWKMENWKLRKCYCLQLTILKFYQQINLIFIVYITCQCDLYYTEKFPKKSVICLLILDYVHMISRLINRLWFYYRHLFC